MNNNIKDMQYLALELTRIRYGDGSKPSSANDILETYKSNLTSLTGLIQDLETIQSLQQEIERLQGLLRIQAEQPDKGLKLHKLIDTVNECKGDMEPYVYQKLMNGITSKIQ